MFIRGNWVLPFLIALLSTESPGQSTSVIWGYVTERNSTGPIPELLVTATSVGQSPSKSYTVKASAGGAFQFERLPGGSYMLCAQPTPSSSTPTPANTFASGCAWDSPTPVTVAPGQRAKNVRINIQRGQSVRIFLTGQATDRRPSTSEVVVGVKDGRDFVAARLARVNGRTLEYEVVIPSGRPVRVDVDSDKLTLQDTAGRPVGPGDRQVVGQAGGQSRELRFNLARSTRP